MKQRGKLSVLLLDDSIISRLFNLKDSIPVHFSSIHLVFGQNSECHIQLAAGECSQDQGKVVEPFLCYPLGSHEVTTLHIFFCNYFDPQGLFLVAVPGRIESGRGRFSRKSNEDEFSRKSNGGWIFLGIKWGLQNNNNNNNNNNMIRLVPARIESGRGKEGLFRDSLVSGGQLHERAS